jgi:GNT-I family
VHTAGGLPQLQFWGAGEECTSLHLQGSRALVGRSGEDAQLHCMWLHWAAGKLAWKLTPATLSVNVWSYVQGSSMGQFYREHLQPVRLNRQDVNWTAQDLSHLEPDAYNAMMRQKLAGGTPA